jgi:hypothetical protein
LIGPQPKSPREVPLRPGAGPLGRGPARGGCPLPACGEPMRIKPHQAACKIVFTQSTIVFCCSVIYPTHSIAHRTHEPTPATGSGTTHTVYDIDAICTFIQHAFEVGSESLEMAACAFGVGITASESGCSPLNPILPLLGRNSENPSGLSCGFRRSSALRRM